MVKNGPVPVFVFLDEHFPHFDEKVQEKNGSENPFEELSDYKVTVISFPKLFRSLGIFDFQVVLFIKKMIFSDIYPIKNFLFRNPEPIFIFFTADYNFIKDAQKGFEKYKKPKRQGVELGDGYLRFTASKDKKEVIVNIAFVSIKSRFRPKNLARKITDELKKVLN